MKRLLAVANKQFIAFVPAQRMEWALNLRKEYPQLRYARISRIVAPLADTKPIGVITLRSQS